ncbi:MAG: TIGR01841 family phasin [Pseudomonadota bacterium]
MTEKTETALQKAMAAPLRLTQGSVVRVRDALSRTARLVASAKQPTKKLGNAGLALNAAAHEGIEQLVMHQVHVVEGLVDDSAERLRLAAEAGSLRSLVTEQAAIFPKTRSRLVSDVRTAVGILSQTRVNMTSAVRDELSAKTLEEAAGDAVEAAGDAAEQVNDAIEQTVAEVTAKG